jgi:AcrR family transcriptional regulator
MPKGFTEREKVHIRAALIEKGKQIFAAYGIKKTNIEDLTRAVGISKGAFYIFYDSKEELFFDIIEQVEEEYRRQILDTNLMEGKTPSEQLKIMLHTAFTAWKTNPLLGNFSREDYEVLLRKLPENKVIEHLRSDDQYIVELAGDLATKGIQLSEDPAIIGGLMKALFYVSLHEDEIGKEVFQQTMSVLIDLVASHLTAGHRIQE